MPLFKKEEIAEEVWIGLWKITEDINYFHEVLKNNVKELKRASEIRHPGRYLQRLATRHLLQHLLNEDHLPPILPDEAGKPCLHLHTYQISIAHSGQFAAVITTKNRSVGIDIEQVKPKIERIADKFTTPEEQAQISGSRLEGLYKYWCAKESLFKLYGKGKINFKQHLSVENINEQQTAGVIKKEQEPIKAALFINKIEDYMLAAAVEQLK